MLLQAWYSVTSTPPRDCVLTLSEVSRSPKDPGEEMASLSQTLQTTSWRPAALRLLGEKDLSPGCRGQALSAGPQKAERDKDNNYRLLGGQIPT